jgi:hypothetical protein
LSFLATIGVRTAMDNHKLSWVEMEKVASQVGETTFFIFFENGIYSNGNSGVSSFLIAQKLSVETTCKPVFCS